MKRISIIFVLLLMVVASGCVHREITHINEHGSAPLSIVQTRELRSYLLVSKFSTRHWECIEKSNQLVCKAVCDTDGSDLSCPGFWIPFWR